MIAVWIVLGTALTYLIFVVIAQFALMRMSLRDAPEPHWSKIYEALWGVHAEMSWTSRKLAKVTMPIGAKIWPPKV